MFERFFAFIKNTFAPESGDDERSLLREAVSLPPGTRIGFHRDIGTDIQPSDWDDDPLYQEPQKRKYIQDLLTIENERGRRIQMYEMMDKSDIASTAIDLYAEDSTLPNPDTGRAIWIEADDSAIKEAAEELLEHIRAEEVIAAIARNIALYGDCFERVLYDDKNGVRDLFWIHPADVRRVQDVYRQLIGFQIGHKSYGPVMSTTPELDHGHPKHPRRSFIMVEPWEVIHFRNTGYFRSTQYGKSILHNAIRPWRQIILAEDHALMYRLSRHPDRLLYILDTGTQGEVEQWRTLNRFRRRLKKQEFVDPISGRYDYRVNPITPIEDIFIAVPRDSNTRVEKLMGSNNVNDVTDIEYYLRKFSAAVRIPAEFLGVPLRTRYQSQVSPERSLAAQSVMYAKSLLKLQRALKIGFRHAIMIHLRLKTHGDPENLTFDWRMPGKSFRVMMQPPSNIDEMDRLDVENIRVTLASSMLQLMGDNPHFDIYNWTVYALKTVLRLSDPEIRKVLNKAGAPYDTRDGALKGEEKQAADAVLAKAGPLIERVVAGKGDRYLDTDPSDDSFALPPSNGEDT